MAKTELLVNVLKSFSPESVVRFKSLPECVQLEIDLAWNDVLSASSALLVFLPIKLSPKATKFFIQILVPILRKSYESNKKTPLLISINKQNFVLTPNKASKTLGLISGLIALALAPKITLIGLSTVSAIKIVRPLLIQNRFNNKDYKWTPISQNLL